MNVYKMFNKSSKSRILECTVAHTCKQNALKMPSKWQTHISENTHLSCFRSLMFNQNKRNLFAPSSTALLPVCPPLCSLTPAVHRLRTPTFAYHAHTNRHLLIHANQWACVHAHTHVLEAYPIVVDLKMYSTNPISEQHTLTITLCKWMKNVPEG